MIVLLVFVNKLSLFSKRKFKKHFRGLFFSDGFFTHHLKVSFLQDVRLGRIRFLLDHFMVLVALLVTISVEDRK
jgi:hypothetical protein